MLGKEELTLHTLAERLYVNPSYLSRLFKREEGKSISEYLLKRSMEHAKELLHNGVKVYDAAEAAGYRDVSYFARVFRKYWGVAPSELKNKSVRSHRVRCKLKLQWKKSGGGGQNDRYGTNR